MSVSKKVPQALFFDTLERSSFLQGAVLCILYRALFYVFLYAAIRLPNPPP